jgi:hypothetical protein
MSTSTGGDQPQSSAERRTGQPPTNAEVEDQGAGIAQAARQKGRQVAGTVTEQAKEVAGNAQRQARNLLQERREQLKEQARSGQHKGAERLESVASELRSMAEKSDQSGPTTNLVLQAADKVQEIASWLQAGEPGDVLVEARNWARRHPGNLVVGFTIVGFIAGRLSRNGVGLLTFGAGWLASSGFSALRARRAVDSATKAGSGTTAR